MGGCPCKKTEKNQNNNINNDNTTRNAILNNQMKPIFVERQYNYQNNPYNNNYKKQCTCGYYKNNYINQNRNIIKQYEIPNLYNKQNRNTNDFYQNPNRNIQQKNNNIKLNSDMKELKQKFKNIKNRYKLYYQDLKIQKECMTNYKYFINELNQQLNDFHEQLNISIYGQKLEENLINGSENIKLLEELENISYKINQLNSILELQNKELKNIEINYKLTQEKLYEIKYSFNNDEINKNVILMVKNDIIHYLNELEEIGKKLEKNKKLYENKKKDIEEDIKKIKNRTEEKVSEIKIKRKTTFKNLNFSQIQNDKLNDPLFLKGSMLFTIKDFSKAKDIFNSLYLFKDEVDENYDKQELIKKNWNEICFIYDDYDIYDVNYELKAVGLPENSVFTSCSFGFFLDTDIKILNFEIDGKKTEYKFEKYSLYFKINLKNMESIKIHIKYKEAPLENKLTEGEIKQRKISRVKYYGLSKRLVGQMAKFTLKNESNFEIINFENEFLIKTKENEYTWGGLVPEGGKTTIIRMSKKEGKYYFNEKYIFKTVNNQPINNTTLKIPFCYKQGNNKLTEFNVESSETKRIKIDEKSKAFAAQYLNINSEKAELVIKGELINRCKGEWNCDLSEEEIESLIPEDFKSNKQMFKEIALRIVKEFDKEHKDDMIKIEDVAKIGKWIKKNVKYDINYSGKNDITATDTYNNLEGVCDHFTKLYNALMYSLGYKVVYVIGYAMDKNDSFGREDAHAWSLIQIHGKWLPFDATWGIFSGKFPVSHVFKQFDCKGIITKGYDYINVGKLIIQGNYLD